MIKNLRKVIFIEIICMCIIYGNYFGIMVISAAEITPVLNRTAAEDSSENVQSKDEITEENKDMVNQENNDGNAADDKIVREIRPSDTAFVSVELIKETGDNNSGKFTLDFNLGDEAVDGVEELALADVFCIEGLDFSFPLEKLNESRVEFELSGLKNKKYKYYIRSVNNVEYEGYFEVRFAESNDENIPKVTFKGFPKKKVFEGTNVEVKLITDNVESKLNFNGKQVNGKKMKNGCEFKLAVSKNGSYKYLVKAGKKVTEGVLKVDFFKKNQTKLDVPLSYQRPAYPEGCESYASVAVLKHFGFKIKESEFISKYLDIINLWDRRVTIIKNLFDKFYLGDPSNKRQQGYLANPPVLVKAVNKFFTKNRHKKYIAVNTTGKSLKTLLEEEVLNDNPVVVWLTIDNRKPYTAKVRGVPYIFPSHTMVVSGYDREKDLLYLTDSISGYRSVSYDTANKLYNLTGKKSFILQARK